jgi:hypothetical protein
MEYDIGAQIGGKFASLTLSTKASGRWAFSVAPTSEVDETDWLQVTANRVALAAVIFGAADRPEDVSNFVGDDEGVFGTESANEAAEAIAVYVQTIIVPSRAELQSDVGKTRLLTAKQQAESLCLAADWSAFYTAMDRAGDYFMEYMKALLDEANAAHVWLAPGKL